MSNWKAVRLKFDKTLQGITDLYDLYTNISEANNVTTGNPEIVKKTEKIIKQAHTPSVVFPFKSETKTK